MVVDMVRRPISLPPVDPRQLGFEFTFPAYKPWRLMSVDELFEKMSAEIAADASENERIERKVAGVRARDLGDYICMWANTAPDGGIMLIGVTDKGEIAGCLGTEVRHMNDLQKAGTVYCPDARFSCKEISAKNAKGKDDYFLAIRVQYREEILVETGNGEAFVRRGDSKYSLSETEKREIQIGKGQLQLEARPSKLSYPDDFNLPLVRDFVERVRKERELSADHTVEEILELRRLGRLKDGRFQPNLSCAMLFAKDPQLEVPGCKIHFTRFDGTVEKTGAQYNAVKTVWIEGSVPQLIEQAEKVLSAQLREFMRLGDGGKFVATSEYPKDAWYEAVVNACVHRSYNLSTMHVTIKMFDDRLEIESPGGFMPLVTPENIYDSHVSRNPHLMDAMYYMKFVLAAHEGTRRIRDSMQRIGLPPPDFRETTATAAGVRVTLKNDVEHRRQFVDSDAFHILGEALAKSLDGPSLRLVNYIAENGQMNATDAMRVGGIRWHAAKKILNTLTERGILEHVKNPKVDRDRHQHWRLNTRFAGPTKGREGSGK